MYRISIKWHLPISLLMSGLVNLGFSNSLGLDSLLKSGLQNNFDLKVIAEESNILASDTLAGIFKSNPVLDIDAGYNFMNPDQPKISARISKEFTGSMNTARQNLAGSRLSAKRNWGKWNEQSLIFEIQAQFFNWQILSQKKSLQTLVEEKWSTLARLAKTKVKEGRLSEIDAIEAELQSTKAKQKKLRFETDLAMIEKKLSLLTGIQFDAGLTIAPILIDSLPPLPSLTSLQGEAMQKNIELKALEKEIEAEQSQNNFEKVLANPTLTLSMGYERETDGTALLAAGLSLPLPMYNRNQNGIEKSQRAVNLTQSKKRATENRIQSEISQAYEKTSRLSLQYSSHQNEILSLVRKQMELSEKGFEHGFLGIFELAKIQEEYLAQEMEGLDLASNYYEEWNRLGLLTGRNL